MRLLYLYGCVLISLAVQASLGQVILQLTFTSVNTPFTDYDRLDDFMGYPLQAYSQLTILSSTATIKTDSGQGDPVAVVVLQMLGCLLTPSDLQMLDIRQSSMWYFNDGISKFGGQFGTNLPSVYSRTVNVLFYDEFDEIIYQDSFNLSASCAWTFRGWQFARPMKKMLWIGPYNGGFMGIDEVRTKKATPITGLKPFPVNCSNTETFSTQAYGNYTSLSVLGGKALVSVLTSGMPVVKLEADTQGSCPSLITATSGKILTPWRPIKISFSTPVLAVGFYFVNTYSPATSSAKIYFYSESDTLLFKTDLYNLACEWDWRGWIFDVPMKYFTVQGGSFAGTGISFDKLMYSECPNCDQSAYSMHSSNWSLTDDFGSTNTGNYSFVPLFNRRLTVQHNSTSGNYVSIISSYQYQQECVLSPQSGKFALALRMMKITFNDPARGFGAYIGTPYQAGGFAQFLFYNADDQLIMQENVTLPTNCTWKWKGWHFNGLFAKTLYIVGPEPIHKGYIVLDSISITDCPRTACDFTGATPFPNTTVEIEDFGTKPYGYFENITLFDKSLWVNAIDPNYEAVGVQSSFTYACTAYAQTGKIMATQDLVKVTFNPPAQMFGGYVTTHVPNDYVPLFLMDFYDTNNQLIRVDKVHIPNNCTWMWKGWVSRVPISRVLFSGPMNGGQIIFDDFRYSSQCAGFL